MTYPYSRRETLADGAVHAIGVTAAVCASAALITYSVTDLTPDFTRAVWIYCVLLVFSLLTSASYHMLPFPFLRPWLRRVDHAAIYLKIAGTYTPLVAAIGTGFAYSILGLVWCIAAAGALAKLTFWSGDGRGSLALYLGMGWLSVLLIPAMISALPPLAILLIAVGGILYSSGTWVYAHSGIRFQNAIWHSVVLVASVCFFVAISLMAENTTTASA